MPFVANLRTCSVSLRWVTVPTWHDKLLNRRVPAGESRQNLSIGLQSVPAEPVADPHGGTASEGDTPVILGCGTVGDVVATGHDSRRLKVGGGSSFLKPDITRQRNILNEVAALLDGGQVRSTAT